VSITTEINPQLAQLLDEAQNHLNDLQDCIVAVAGPGVGIAASDSDPVWFPDSGAVDELVERLVGDLTMVQRRLGELTDAVLAASVHQQ